MSLIIKKGNKDGIIDVVQRFREYDIVLKTKVLLNRSSISEIIERVITIIFINLVFIINYMILKLYLERVFK